jgi:hypothetical protein
MSCAAADSALKDSTEYGPFCVAGLRRRQVGRGAHLEKLVEVGRDDAQKPQPLQQRHVRALGPVQHPLIEGKNAVVAVQELDGWRGGGHRGG